MRAIILAGGFGTRLGKLSAAVPKPMQPIGGRPFLHWLLADLQKKGFTRAVLSCGHKAEVIEAYFQANRIGIGIGIEVEIVIEPAPLGTGGAIRHVLQREVPSAEPLFIVNGDTFFDIDYRRLLETHRDSGNTVDLAALPKRLLRDAARYGSLQTEGAHVVSFSEKTERADAGQYINGGIYAVSADRFLPALPALAAFSLEKEYLEAAARRKEVGFLACDGYFIDIGIPEDLQRAQKEIPEKYS